MADAGFNPDDAISLWTTMANTEGAASGTMSFLSSHPASDERLEQLHTLLPAARERYQTALSLPPQKTSKRRPQFEPDAFSRGTERPQQRGNEWTVDDPTNRKKRNY
jgi:predicted Zn-dependent protease